MQQQLVDLRGLRRCRPALLRRLRLQRRRHHLQQLELVRGVRKPGHLDVDRNSVLRGQRLQWRLLRDPLQRRLHVAGLRGGREELRLARHQLDVDRAQAGLRCHDGGHRYVHRGNLQLRGRRPAVLRVQLLLVFLVVQLLRGSRHALSFHHVEHRHHAIRLLGLRRQGPALLLRRILQQQQLGLLRLWLGL